MKKDTAIKLFEDKKVRSTWSDETDKWYFSVIDIVAVLTEQTDYKKAQSYWTTLKGRLKKEGSEVVTNCDELKLEASREQLFFKKTTRTYITSSTLINTFAPNPKNQQFIQTHTIK